MFPTDLTNFEILIYLAGGGLAAKLLGAAGMGVRQVFSWAWTHMITTVQDELGAGRSPAPSEEAPGSASRFGEAWQEVREEARSARERHRKCMAELRETERELWKAEQKVSSLTERVESLRDRVESLREKLQHANRQVLTLKSQWPSEKPLPDIPELDPPEENA
jgi:septal ring factor EnvC (AmiA/AmiB activator)